MAFPTFVGLGAFASSAGAITPVLPAGIATNDLLLLFLETHQETATVPTPNGGTWTQAPSSPQGSGSFGANSSARITVFYSFYNGTQGNPTTNDPGDHISGRIAAFRGVNLNNPFNTSSGGVNTDVGSTTTVNGGTTTVAQCLVIGCGATEDDGDSIGAWTAGSGLANFTEMFENIHTAGDQGLITAWRAEKATAGAYGNSTATMTPSGQRRAFMSLALNPVNISATLAVTLGGASLTASATALCAASLGVTLWGINPTASAAAPASASLAVTLEGLTIQAEALIGRDADLSVTLEGLVSDSSAVHELLATANITLTKLKLKAKAQHVPPDFVGSGQEVNRHMWIGMRFGF